jgi:hypothetical protein
VAEEKPAAEGAAEELQDAEADDSSSDKHPEEANTLPDLMTRAQHPAEPSGPRILALMLTRGLDAVRSIRSSTDALYAAWWRVRSTGDEAIPECGTDKLQATYVAAVQGLRDVQHALENLDPMPVARASDDIDYVRRCADDIFHELGAVCTGVALHGGRLPVEEIKRSEAVTRYAYVEVCHGLRVIETEIAEALRELREEVLAPEPLDDGDVPSRATAAVRNLFEILHDKIDALRLVVVGGLEDLDAQVEGLARGILPNPA